MDSVVVLKKINKSIGNKEILCELDLEIRRGDCISIIGESGVGKTTLLNILALLDNKYDGCYILDRVDVSYMDDIQSSNIRNEKIGIIMQDYKLIENYTVYDNIIIPLIYSKKKNRVKIQKDRIMELIEKFGLNGKEKQKVCTLSGGERQRVAIIRAIINEPELIIADEPTAALDKKNATYICKMLKELNNMGTTLVVVTHNKDEFMIANKKYKLENGKLDMIYNIDEMK